MPTSLNPVIDFLRSHAPFDKMAMGHLEFMAKRLSLSFYARGEVILSPSDGPAKRLYIIKQGRVRGETREGEGSDSAWELVAGEAFPVGALLARRPPNTVERAAEDTFCFELEREDFDRLIAQSEVFHDFCTRRIANLLDNALRNVQARSATRVSEDTSLNAPISTLINRAPITCNPDSPVSEALALMDYEHIGSVVVVDDQQKPRGVFTLHDVLSRIALPQRDPSTPLREVMTRNPHCVGPDARAYEAALLMAQHGFSHICVVENGKLVGVVSERDLFSLQRIGLVSLSRSITRAEDIATLKQLMQNIYRLVDQMLAQGASVGQLTQIITALNDSITQRAILLIMSEIGKPSVDFTWLAFGSEGRAEQTLKTDQDNGLLFITPVGKTAEATRLELLPLAQRINQALNEIGFPLCPRNNMASNPAYCLSMEEWQTRFGQWIEHGTLEQLHGATIFFDFRPVFGTAAHANNLRQWMFERTAGNPRFRALMTENALSNRPPLGLMGDLVVRDEGIDLKVHGTTPFVDAARILSLANKVNETNTVARLKSLSQTGKVREQESEAWCHAYLFLMLLRMRNHQQQAHDGKPLSNLIDPDTLDDLDRRILKESFRQARKLQSYIAREFQ